MARPSKLTPELRRKICDDIRAGRQVEEAADAAGISRKTLHRWMLRGETTRFGPHREFYVAVRAALVETRAALLQTLRRASRYDARAAAYLLARSYDRVRSTRPRRRETDVEAAVGRILGEGALDSDDDVDREPAKRRGVVGRR